MNIEVIGKDKIKVLISQTELAQRHLTHDAIKNGSQYLNEFLFEVMERIRHTTSFDPYAGQVVVEAMKNEGGLMLIISRTENVKQRLSVKDKEKIRKAKAVLKEAAPREAIYIFNDFEDLLDALKELNTECFLNSVIYKENGVYYFYLNQTEGFLHSDRVLSEFSCDSVSISIKDYLKEHSEVTLLCDDLINIKNNI